MSDQQINKNAARAYGAGASSTSMRGDGVVGNTIAPNAPFIVSSDSETAKPFISTTRTTGSMSLVKEKFNNELDSDIMRALEGVPKTIRGARLKPSVMRFPTEIGSGEIPHVMQFKVFWRWENNDILNTMKMEAEKVKTGLTQLTGLIRQELLTKENIEQSGLSSEEISALKELVNSSDVLKVVDPRFKDNLATLLTTNPRQAKAILEETIRAYDTRLQNIEAELSEETGKIGLSEQERMRVLDDLNTTIAQGKPEDAALAGGLAGLAAWAALGFAVGGPVGGAVGAGVALGVGVIGGMLLSEGAKLYQNQAVYDQMISIYLPFCNKINNEDGFQFEDTEQIVSKAVFDALGQVLDTAKQGLEAGGIAAGDAVLGKGAASIARGKIINPRLEKLFKQKDFRNFNFQWDFYPKNKQEVEQVREIIEAFRYHAHPATDNFQGEEVGENEKKVQIILRVPAEFEIRFLSTNPDPNAAGFVENEYIPRIGRCALNSISVDYTTNGVYSSFVDNSPTAISLTLQFSEMGVLTREGVDKGY